MRNAIAVMICLIFFSSHSLFAKAFHLFMVGDTKDKKIGKIVEVDLKNVAESFVYVADVCKVPLHVHKMTSHDKKFTYTHLKESLHKAHIAKDDVIIFYYSGHGCRLYETHMIWPYLFFEDGVVDSAKVMKKVFLKRAALSVVLMNSCNGLATNVLNKNINLFRIKPFLASQTTNNCFELFFKKCGILIACATKPGELAAGLLPGYKNNELKCGGSYFTNASLNNFFEILHSSSAEWKSIFKKIKKMCQEEVREGSQTPQYTILLGSKKKKVREYMHHLATHCLYRRGKDSFDAPSDEEQFDEDVRKSVDFEMNIDEPRIMDQVP